MRLNTALAFWLPIVALCIDESQLFPKVLVIQKETDCPNDGHTNCTTFSELLVHPNNYFTSNTVVEFQPGEYNTETYGADFTLSIVGVSNLTITGNNARLNCSRNSSVSFAIYNCTDFTVSGIDFNGCSSKVFQTANITLQGVTISSANLSFIDSQNHMRVLQSQLLNTPFTVLQQLNASRQITLQIRNSSFVESLVNISILNTLSMEINFTFVTFKSDSCNRFKAWIETSVCTQVKTNFHHIINITLKMNMAKCSTCIEDKDTKQELILSACTTDTRFRNGAGLIELSGLDKVVIEQIIVSNKTLSGPVFLIKNSVLIMKSIQFTYNYNYYAIIQVEESDTLFVDNICLIKNSGLFSGVLLKDSNITFNGTTFFSGNKVSGNGGALSMFGKSYLKFYTEAVNVTFQDNHATRVAGAIYVDYDYGKSDCFFQFLQPPIIGLYSISFKRNKADYAGSIMYGGNVRNCARKLRGNRVWYKSLKRYIQFEYNKSDTSQIAEEPNYICKCTPNSVRGYSCLSSLGEFKIYPGQSIAVEIAVIGLSGDTVPGTVIVTSNDSFTQIIPKYQAVGRTCQSLQYTIISSEHGVLLYLSVEEGIRHCNFWKTKVFQGDRFRTHKGTCTLPKKIRVKLEPCPIGFNLTKGVCICTSILLNYSSIQCDINTETIYRPSPYWISTSSQIDGEKIILVHENCPLSYCMTQDTLYLNLLQPDSQCANNRSGILCGQCQGNHSLVLGGSQCRQCSDIWLLLIPVFMAAGLLLILFLTFLNMTVSVGNINGLVFFTNIVQANRYVFFASTEHSLNYFLGIFVAWINLDFGFNVCFYNGMNGYAKMWLQFVFPAYLWLILIVFIILSHYFTSVAKLCRPNIVSVLSTLFFLSYTKLLRTVIAILSVTYLNYPTGRKAVWLFDANIEYAKGKHLPLFLTALLVLICFSIPYTLFLLTAQWMQYYSDFKLFKWIHRVKPIIDAHTGPYKNKYRFWTGLLLLFRVMLVIVFSTNVTGDPRINTLAIIVATSVLLLLALTGGVYKNMLINILEWSNYLSLLLLSATTLYILSGTSRNTSPLQQTVTGVYVGLSVLTFLVVTSWHILQETNLIRLCKKIRSKKLVKTECEEASPLDQVRICTITSSEIRLEELEEPLLES